MVLTRFLGFDTTEAILGFAFGTRNEELVIEKPISDFHFPKEIKPYPGMEIALVATSAARA